MRKNEHFFRIKTHCTLPVNQSNRKSFTMKQLWVMLFSLGLNLRCQATSASQMDDTLVDKYMNAIIAHITHICQQHMDTPQKSPSTSDAERAIAQPVCEDLTGVLSTASHPSGVSQSSNGSVRGKTYIDLAHLMRLEDAFRETPESHHFLKYVTCSFVSHLQFSDFSQCVHVIGIKGTSQFVRRLEGS